MKRDRCGPNPGGAAVVRRQTGSNDSWFRVQQHAELVRHIKLDRLRQPQSWAPVAPPRLINTRACRSETAAGESVVTPRPFQPACSISQPAGSFTSSPVAAAGYWGIVGWRSRKNNPPGRRGPDS